MLIKRQNVSNKKRNIRTIIFVGIFFVLFLIPTTRSAIKSFFVFVTYPIVYSTHFIEDRFSLMIETLQTKSSLIEENKNLENQISNLNAQYSNYQELANENKELKATLNRASGMDMILAVVLSKPPTSMYDTIIIDGGKKVGMEVGQAVYVNGYSPIGTLVQVFEKTALVELYSSPSEKMDARLDPSHIDVTLFGHGGGNYLVSVPHDFVVPENSIVVSKEINPHVLGRLEKAISDPRDSSQTLIFSSPVNLNQISFVEVLK